MNPIELPIHHDEWIRIYNVADAADADDLINPPILVAPPPEAGDKTHWRIRGQNGTIVEVPHDLASAGPFCVAVPRTVIDSGRLMAIQEGGCLLKILPEGYAILTGNEGSEAVFDLPAVPADLDLPPTMQPVATATTTARQMTDAIFMCGRFPVGFDPEGPAPCMEFAIEESAVSFGADWRRFGRANCTYRAPARTSGTTAVGLLCATVRYLLIDATGRDENVTVSVFGDWVCFESESWKAWAPRVEVGAARCLTSAIEALEKAGLAPRRLSDVSVEIDGHPPVRIEFVDCEPEVLRLSTVLATGLVADAALRSEVDAIMASRVGLRLWFEDSRLVAAEDLLCEWISELPTIFHRFRNQLTGLDLLLASSNGPDQENLLAPTSGEAVQ